MKRRILAMMSKAYQCRSSPTFKTPHGPSTGDSLNWQGLGIGDTAIFSAEVLSKDYDTGEEAIVLPSVQASRLPKQSKKSL